MKDKAKEKKKNEIIIYNNVFTREIHSDRAINTDVFDPAVALESNRNENKLI